jgi:hypothetical protein
MSKCLVGISKLVPVIMIIIRGHLLFWLSLQLRKAAKFYFREAQVLQIAEALLN